MQAFVRWIYPPDSYIIKIRLEKYMFLIAGLGNPGTKYEHTRHNAGFDTIDALAEKYGIEIKKSERKALSGQGVINGEKVILIKPQTFMNLSGESVGDFVNFYKLDPETQLIVFSDDVTLEAGNIRIRKKGSAGGHNGLKNIIEHVGTDKFVRIRLGVGIFKSGDMADFVLSRLPQEDRQFFDEAKKRACKAAELVLAGDVNEAMNEFNAKTR